MNREDPYVVLARAGCPHCGRRRVFYNVVAEFDAVIGDFTEQAKAEELAELLNAAYHAGQQSIRFDRALDEALAAPSVQQASPPTDQPEKEVE